MSNNKDKPVTGTSVHQRPAPGKDPTQVQANTFQGDADLVEGSALGPGSGVRRVNPFVKPPDPVLETQDEKARATAEAKAKGEPEPETPDKPADPNQARREKLYAELVTANNGDSKPFVDQLRSLTSLWNDYDKSVLEADPNAVAGYQRLAYFDSLADSVQVDPLEKMTGVNSIVARQQEGEEAVTSVNMVDALIYIQGVEISNILSGSLTITKNGRDGVNTATFSLTNKQDALIWQEKDLQLFFGEKNFDFSLDDLDRTNQEIEEDDDFSPTKYPRFGQHEEIKGEMFYYKSDPKRNPLTLTSLNVVQFARFDLAPQRCIFNRLDPVRIWVRYPYDSGEPLWIPEFTGYVERTSIVDDDISGHSLVTVECSCIRGSIFQNMKVSTDLNLTFNPLTALGFAPLGLGRDGEAPPDPEAPVGQVAARARQLKEIQEATGYYYNQDEVQFYDDIAANVFNAFSPGTSIEESLRALLLFKPENLKNNVGNRGIRNITFGGTFSYDMTEPRERTKAYLSDYHTFAIFGPKLRPWTTEEVQEVGKGTTTDGAFAPNDIRLWELLPKDGTGPRNLVNQEAIGFNQTSNVNWQNRLMILQNFLDAVDYQIQVTGYGDIILEFNMADFRPEDFGDEWKWHNRIDNGLISTHFGDEQELPVSGVAGSFNLGVGASGFDSGTAAGAKLTTVFAYAPYLVARYGVNILQTQFPFLTRNEKAMAQQRTVIEMQKHNSRCHVMSFEFTYRPMLLPNRPLHHLRRDRMGTIVSITYTINLGSGTRSTVNVGLDYIKLWTGSYRSAGIGDLSSPLRDRFLALQAEENQATDIVAEEQVLELTDDTVVAEEVDINLDSADSPPDIKPKKDLNFQEAQQKEFTSRGTTVADFLKTVDTKSLDKISLKIFNTVMAGESVPMSNKVGWGAERISPASAVYITEPLDNVVKDIQAAVEAAGKRFQIREGISEGSDQNDPNERDPRGLLAPILPRIDKKFKETLKAYSIQYTGSQGEIPGSIMLTAPNSSYYKKEETVKNSIFIHSTCGRLDASIQALTTRNNVSTHFVAARDGTIYQLFPTKFWAFHAGARGSTNTSVTTKLSKHSIAIEIDNIGPLVLDEERKILKTTGQKGDGSDGRDYCRLDQEEFYKKIPYRGYEYYATFTPEQLRSVKTIMDFYSSSLKFPLKFISPPVQHEYFTASLERFTVLYHSNVQPEGRKLDPGPLFDYRNLGY